MPLGRYFLFVGSLLIGLLFFTERYLQSSPTQIALPAYGVDKSIIRISIGPAASGANHLRYHSASYFPTEPSGCGWTSASDSSTGKTLASGSLRFNEKVAEG